MAWNGTQVDLERVARWEDDLAEAQRTLDVGDPARGKQLFQAVHDEVYELSHRKAEPPGVWLPTVVGVSSMPKAAVEERCGATDVRNVPALQDHLRST